MSPVEASRSHPLPSRVGAVLLVIGSVIAPPCALSRAAPSESDQDCVARLESQDRSAVARGVDPGDARPIPGYPGMATNRVLAAFDPVSLSEAQRAAWLQRLLDTGQRRRRLQAETHAALNAGEGTGFDEAECAAVLEKPRPTTDDALVPLAAAARVRDDYLLWRRIIGIYPLTSLPVRAGVGRLQEETQASFSAPLDSLPVEGVLRRYGPRLPIVDAPALPASARDALGVRVAAIPDPVLEALFARHAPILEVDSSGPFDIPGRPFFGEPGRPDIEPTAPTAYQYASVMPLAGRLRLQLNYVFWFAERPRSGAFDTLGGALDGLTWRVTLDEEAQPLVYDTIHPCGCYHMLFPGEHLRLRESALRRPEPPLLPQAAPELEAGERILLRIASRTHYLQRVRAVSVAEGNDDETYTLSPYASLYAVDAPGGQASLFARHGLVPGTGRGERFYLWPMGIRSPGAMRERGRQATAFLGRRHFDDADLLDALFSMDVTRR